MSTVTNRRQFLAGSAVAATAVAFAACGGDDDQAALTTVPDTTAGESEVGRSDSGSTDLEIAAFAASLELLAVNTYQAALDAAGQGALGEVPAAVAEFVTTARAHHQEHHDAWNGVLESAGEPLVSEPPADLEATVNSQFASVSDVTGAAELALMLEQTAAATYLDVIPKLAGNDAIGLAGSILSVDQQHAAVLLYVLGQYPVPETFLSTTKSAAPA